MTFPLIGPYFEKEVFFKLRGMEPSERGVSDG